MQSKSCHNICYPSGLISSASWCKQGLLHSSMLGWGAFPGNQLAFLITSTLPGIGMKYQIIWWHPFIFPKELLTNCTFLDGIVDDDYSWWVFVVKCQGSWFQTWRFVVFFAGLIGCRSRNGCHLTPSDYYFLDLKIRQLHFWCVGYVCISVCLCV